MADSSAEAQELLQLARARYELAYEQEQYNVEAALDDLNFVAGNQWPGDIQRERMNDNRPVLTVNRLPQFVRQVTGDIRLNKPSIKVAPAGSEASEEIAEIYTGLIRNIEVQSDAQTTYVLAAESAARCGWGAFRLTTEYCDDDVFEQDIRIRRIADPLGVYFDPDARELDRSDARWCFVVTRYTWERFKEMYPDATISSWDAARPLTLEAGWGGMWMDEREIAVAEYWVKLPVQKKLGQKADGSVEDITDKSAEETKALGIVKTREVEAVRVKQYIMSGAEILKEYDWAGKYIPIVPVLGEEVNVGDQVVRHGVIRFAKDPQRMYNYHQTVMTEVHALAPKAPFIGTAEQFKGFEKEWRQANRRNMPYLRYNPDGAAPPPARSQVSTDISTSLQLSQVAVDDMYGTTGIYPASLGNKSNEQSGKAILARQRESDVGTYVYVDNLSKSIAYVGRQLVDLIPKIYDTTRVVRVMQEDGESELVEVNSPMGMVPTDADERVLNDITVGRYDVVVEVGPAFSTRRAEAATAMTEFAKMNPQGANLVMDLIADSQDWPNADKFAERFRRALPQGIDPEIDAQRMQEQGPPKPDPLQVAFTMEAQGKAQKAVADAQVSQVKARTALVEAGQTQAEIGKTNAETHGIEIDNATKALELAVASGDLGSMIRQVVTQELQAVLGRMRTPL